MTLSRPVRVFAISSGKGGVGKTNISVNIGVALGQEGYRVALLDADMGLANVDVLLGLQPKFNLSHVLAGEKNLDEIMVTTSGGLKVVPGSSGLQHMSDLTTVEQGAVIHAFSEIQQELDFLIVDTAAGIHSSVVNFARACQDIMVVVCDEPTSLTDAYAFIKLLNRDYGLFRFQVIANMVSSARQGRQLYEKLCRVTDHYLDVTLNFMGAVPHDNHLRKAIQKQTPVLEAFPASPSAIAFRSLAKKVANWPKAPDSSGQLEFFVERMIQYSRRGEGDYVL